MRTTWLTAQSCNIDDFIELVATEVDLADYPHAARIEQGTVVFDAVRLRAAVVDPVSAREVQAEFVSAMFDGPGIIVVAGAFTPDVIDAASEAFWEMIADQHSRGATAGDHYAKPGANDRVWNALEKLAVAQPRVFADYYANDLIALVCGAWLGPAYQITSQVNVVKPGGAAQQPHRDYHLGFQTEDVAARFPGHAHALSPVLTLQGAIAHCDMPLESGPTLYMPHSQKYAPGYLAWWHPEFREYFAEHRVQLPLSKGDAVFFNPAVFHAAGDNHSTHIQRMANLLQVSSAFGRAMESIDRERMSNALYPTLVEMRERGANEDAIRNVIAASAEGYPFPTNLDRDAPVDGLAPESQADIVWQAVQKASPASHVADELRQHAGRRLTS